MAWVALNCPQCSAPLPRVAIWRSVKCPSCGALITRTESIVQRDSFRQALARAQQGFSSTGDIQCGGESYALMGQLGKGDLSQVYLARRIGLLPFLAIIKLSSAPTAAAQYTREAEVLRELQTTLVGAASAYSFRHLPLLVAHGAVAGNAAKHALVMSYADGYWGSLEALNAQFPKGMDPRHSVWIWRRLLDALQFLHAQGWSHNDVRPEHALVHPANHAVRLIGWASAQKNASTHQQAADLARSARIILVLLSGGNASGIPAQVPPGLSQLVTRASQDEEFCRDQGARGLDTLLRTAAHAAFGPPVFLPLAL